MDPTATRDTPNAPTEQEKQAARIEYLKSELRTFIHDARDTNEAGSPLRSRALSETITCAEAAYLWLCQSGPNPTDLTF